MHFSCREVRDADCCYLDRPSYFRLKVYWVYILRFFTEKGTIAIASLFANKQTHKMDLKNAGAMKIIVDENMPYAEELFSQLGEVILKTGSYPDC